jgi:hypothetical protein
MPWQCHHPTEIPRAQWLGWLTEIAVPSPYLLPEWGLFWESVWAHSQAELWVLADADGNLLAGIPLVRRRRLGWEMCYAQPMGTPCGPFRSRGRSSDDISVSDFLSAAIGSRTVEFAVHPDIVGDSLDHWRKQILGSETWILSFEQSAGAARRGYSESHWRNIDKGQNLSPRLTSLKTDADVSQLMSAWVDPPHPSRFVLNRTYARALVRLFGPTGALRFHAAWMDSKPVAATIFLVHGDVAVYVDGAFDRERAFQGVGHFFFAETLNCLDAEGVRTVDLGGGPAGATAGGLAQFKRGWGGVPVKRTTAIYRRPWYHMARSLLRRGH